ncbi:MAG: WGR domain-containing protein [Limnobacter sp. CACIAM 66H1]|nr:MAG: WGR domain-containing protein [Limnobacter sp. CACIAM 66H1]
MSDVYLTRVDASQNMARYCRMTVQPTLFGKWSLVREWGRVGRGGQVRVVPYPSEGEAAEAMSELLRRRARRGYAIVG